MTYTRSNMPQVLHLGMKDESSEVLPPQPLQQPQHFPLFYLCTEKGPLTPQICTLSDAQRIYGTETFNSRGKYFTHQTKLAMKVMGQGQSVMIKRLEKWDDAESMARTSTEARLFYTATIVPFATGNEAGTGPALSSAQLTVGTEEWRNALNSPWLKWGRGIDETDLATYGRVLSSNRFRFFCKDVDGGNFVNIVLPVVAEDAAPSDYIAVAGRTWSAKARKQALVNDNGSTLMQQHHEHIIRFGVSADAPLIP